MPITALAEDITEKQDYSDRQTSPTKLSQKAPFTIAGTLDNGSFGGDVDCVAFTTDERARYVFEFSSDTQVFIPTVGLIKLTTNNDFLTLTKNTPNTPADTASVYFDFDKGETVTIVMAMASAEVPEGKNPYTLKVTKTDIPSVITGFALPGIALSDVVIDLQTSTVTAVAPVGSNLANIVPVIEGALGENAVFIPATTQPQDFSRPVKYKLSSETGSLQEWTIIVRVAGEKEGIADLKSVFIDGEPFAEFSPGVTQYDITVPYDKKDIGFAAKALSDLATLSERFVSKPLEVGANAVNITVTAENGDQKIYTFSILREPESTIDAAATDKEEPEETEPMPPYAVIGIVVVSLASVGLTLYLLRNKLFFRR
jgi:hypothetical protein